MRLFLKAVEDQFKYQISLIELYYREQWTEKGFVFNIIGFVFDSIVLLLNVVITLADILETLSLHFVSTVLSPLLAGRDH